MNVKKISIVIPVYGAPLTLHKLCAKIIDSVSKIKQSFEIILVNDACPKGSWEEMVKLCNSNQHIKGINLVRNFGQHNAMACGLKRATGDYVVVMDCDLQDDPAHIQELFHKAEQGYDVVLAKRVQKQVSGFKKFQSWFFYKILKHGLGVNLSHEVGNFGIYSKRVISELNKIGDQVRFFPYLVSWLGFKTSSIEVVQSSREEDKSSYTFSKLLKLSTEFLITSSSKPLMWSIFLGIFCSFFSFLVGVVFVVRYFALGVAPTGWTSLSVSILFSTGLILLNMGILGLYLARVYEQGKNRPLYLVDTQLNIE